MLHASVYRYSVVINGQIRLRQETDEEVASSQVRLQIEFISESGVNVVLQTEYFTIGVLLDCASQQVENPASVYQVTDYLNGLDGWHPATNPTGTWNFVDFQTTLLYSSPHPTCVQSLCSMYFFDSSSSVCTQTQSFIPGAANAGHRTPNTEFYVDYSTQTAGTTEYCVRCTLTNNTIFMAGRLDVTIEDPDCASAISFPTAIQDIYQLDYDSTNTAGQDFYVTDFAITSDADKCPLYWQARHYAPGSTNTFTSDGVIIDPNQVIDWRSTPSQSNLYAGSMVRIYQARNYAYGHQLELKLFSRGYEYSKVIILQVINWCAPSLYTIPAVSTVSITDYQLNSTQTWPFENLQPNQVDLDLSQLVIRPNSSCTDQITCSQYLFYAPTHTTCEAFAIDSISSYPLYGSFTSLNDKIQYNYSTETAGTFEVCVRCSLPGYTEQIGAANIQAVIEPLDCSSMINPQQVELNDLYLIPYYSNQAPETAVQVDLIDFRYVATTQDSDKCPIFWQFRWCSSTDSNHCGSVNMTSHPQENWTPLYAQGNSTDLEPGNTLQTSLHKIMSNNVSAVEYKLEFMLLSRGFFWSKNVTFRNGCNKPSLTLSAEYKETLVLNYLPSDSESPTFYLPKFNLSSELDCLIDSYLIEDLPSQLQFIQTESQIVLTVKDQFKSLNNTWTVQIKVNDSEGDFTIVSASLKLVITCQVNQILVENTSPQILNITISQVATIDISQQLTSGDATNCPIQEFEISQVLDQNANLLASHPFTIDSQGMITVPAATSAYQGYQIFCKAYDGSKWEPFVSVKVADVTQYDPYAMPIQSSGLSEPPKPDSTEAAEQVESNESSSSDSMGAQLSMQRVSDAFRASFFDSYGIEQDTDTPAPTEQRELTARVLSIDQIGNVNLLFSEAIDMDCRIFSIDYRNLSLQGLLFDVEYTSHYLDNPDKKPVLQSFLIKSITEFEVIIGLNLTNPLYVSAGQLKDDVQVKFVTPQVFRAKVDKGLMIVDDLTLADKIGPQFASEAEQKAAQKVVGSATSSFDATIFIPLVFNLISSINMVTIWSTVSILQLVVAFKEFQRVKLTAYAQLLLEQLDISVNFRLNKHPWIAEQIQKHSQKVSDFIDSLGFMILSAIVFLVLILMLLVAAVLFKRNKKVKKVLQGILRSFMWASVFRSLITGYLLQIMGTLQLLEAFDMGEKLVSTVIGLIKLPLLLAFPFFSVWFLIKNSRKLTGSKFRESYGTLYDEVRLRELGSRPKLPLLTSTVFMLIRVMFSVLAVFATSQLVAQLGTLTFTVLASCCFVIEARPLDAPWKNQFELVSQFFLLTGTYCLFLFTDFTDIEIRQDIGKFFFYYILAFTGLSLMFSIVCIVQQLKDKWELNQRKNARIKQYEELGEFDNAEKLKNQEPKSFVDTKFKRKDLQNEAIQVKRDKLKQLKQDKKVSDQQKRVEVKADSKVQDKLEALNIDNAEIKKRVDQEQTIQLTEKQTWDERIKTAYETTTDKTGLEDAIKSEKQEEQKAQQREEILLAFHKVDHANVRKKFKKLQKKKESEWQKMQRTTYLNDYIGRHLSEEECIQVRRVRVDYNEDKVRTENITDVPLNTDQVVYYARHGSKALYDLTKEYGDANKDQTQDHLKLSVELKKKQAANRLKLSQSKIMANLKLHYHKSGKSNQTPRFGQ